MQQSSCEDIQLLISRYVDDEVTPGERELVEAHVAICEACAFRLLEWVEMAVVATESPMRQPDPEMGGRLFREINTQKEEARRRENRALKESADRRMPDVQGVPVFATPTPFPRRFLRAVASPVMAAVIPLFLLVGALYLGSRLFPATPAPIEPSSVAVVPPIPTSETPLDRNGEPPPPVETKVGLSAPDVAPSTTSYMSATATLGTYTLISLRQPTPVLEESDAGTDTDRHTMRDPIFGYKVAYPANWWTETVKNTRYFYPWNVGGTQYAPYWIELRVDPNSDGLTAATANQALCDGGCILPNGNLGWLSGTSSDDHNSYEFGYRFDRNYIYRLKLSVPREGMDGFAARSKEGENVYTTMSGRLSLVGEQVKGDFAFGATLILRGSGADNGSHGSDLYIVPSQGSDRRRLTYDGGVKAFALSPDMSRVAFAATVQGQASETWAKYIYIVNIAGSNGPQVLVSNMDDIHDLAWYSDRDLVFLARNAAGVLGLYMLRVPASGASASSDTASAMEPEQLVALGPEQVGARALAVSPDRQLITFLAPLGGNENTDIYGVRPDGSDLRVIVSHAAPVALDPTSQAIKSYSWMTGHLEPGGYVANILFTCGSYDSPTYVLGGALYSGPRDSVSPLVDTSRLVSYQPEELQITNIAYSAWGKVAFTGYRDDYDNRADKLQGLWVADMADGQLSSPVALPIPEAYHGIADMQWSPDGKSLIYRETSPQANEISARYNGEASFRLISLEVTTGRTTVLFDSAPQS